MHIYKLIEQVEGATNFGLGQLRPQIIKALERVEVLLEEKERLEGDLGKAEAIVDAYKDLRSDIAEAMIQLEDRIEDL